jgi:hypothetical protein
MAMSDEEMDARLAAAEQRAQARARGRLNFSLPARTPRGEAPRTGNFRERMAAARNRTERLPSDLPMVEAAPDPIAERLAAAQAAATARSRSMPTGRTPAPAAPAPMPTSRAAPAGERQMPPDQGERQLPTDRGERQLPPRPAGRSAPPRAPARPAELSADVLMALGSGERVPANQAERIALINMERRRGEIAAEPYKKGGLVTPKKGVTSKMPANKPPAGIASAKTPFKFAKGGASKMKHEDEAMDKKLIRSEMAKAGVGAKGGKGAKYARGGGVEIRGKTRGKLV